MALLIIFAIPWGISLVALLLSAATDLRDRIIPNEFVLLIAASGLALGLTLRPELVWVSLLAAALVLGGLGVLSHFDLLGGGDVKLISALTLLVAPQHIGSLLVGIVLAGGLLGCIYYAVRHVLERRVVPQRDRSGPGQRQSASHRLLQCERARIVAGEPMPYALAVLGGVVAHIARVLPQCLSATSCSL